jgi:hypothetical protein
MQDKTSSLSTTSAQIGLDIHAKTKVLKINTSSTVTLYGNNLEEVGAFTYLGSVINQQGDTETDVKSRIGKARTAFTTLKNI